MKFGTLGYIFPDRTLPVSLKRQVQYLSKSYGAETWTTTKRLEEKLRVTKEDLREKSREQYYNIKTIKSKKLR